MNHLGDMSLLLGDMSLLLRTCSKEEANVSSDVIFYRRKRKNRRKRRSAQMTKGAEIFGFPSKKEYFLSIHLMAVMDLMS